MPTDPVTQYAHPERIVLELAPGIAIIRADCRDVLPELSGIDAVVTDPPYGLSFMGKHWDYDVPSIALWQAVLAAMKPGAHLLSFAGTRTQHRMACAIEDAGFEIRDMIAWVYGSGFPKSLDVSKAIDKAAGAEREDAGIDHEWIRRVGLNHAPSGTYTDKCYGSVGPNGGKITAPATEAARQWAGFGTALKPSLEPITLARKPLIGTVAANVLEYGTGALNVDGCRVGTSKNVPASVSNKAQANCYGKYAEAGETPGVGGHDPNIGRWPANLIHDGSEEVMALFPMTTSGSVRPHIRSTSPPVYGLGMAQKGKKVTSNHNGDTGSAARFFYTAKASKADRDYGCDGLEEREMAGVAYTTMAGDGRTNPAIKPASRRNHHPTVKPTDLMRYLCRLVTPPKGIILDPFMGSGSTGKAAMREGFHFIGIERDPEYFEIARRRLERELAQGRLDFA